MSKIYIAFEITYNLTVVLCTSLYLDMSVYFSSSCGQMHSISQMLHLLPAPSGGWYWNAMEADALMCAMVTAHIFVDSESP